LDLIRFGIDKSKIFDYELITDEIINNVKIYIESPKKNAHL
jgi:hypothetical protein